ncbi:uncharacterized protein YecE (DUF72 family) [Novosphingobium sp. PhB165]|uniref:DUF72 domain-containing protein n=1 Tax=Novosphingobium sp. PhB165 TaxID=2485105 RepID=UPI001053548A|nr:DUF72 domain-containing protein [Novosphingobium sp. PhB165]TCM19820.1 uncharacterized protein YecE (DUF72 family) [Novosphingobium sp. PhB165]
MSAGKQGSIHIGIGGWSYDPWRETFYPKTVSKARELEYVGQNLTGTEINATFYGRQKPASFAKWRDTVPDGFHFALKGSRYCTNRKNLGEAGESIMNFVEQGLVELGDKLGPINWQLAATKKFDADEIAAFLALLPARHEGLTLRHAIEARHESFDDPAFFDLVHKAGVAVILADSPKYPVMDTTENAPFIYARLQNARAEIEQGYPDAELDAWANRARDWSKDGKEVFIFFINGAKERAPAAAMALIEKLR